MQPTPTEAEIKQKADDLATYTLQAEIIKRKIENLKGFFENLAAETLTDTKLKSAEYWGNQNVKVVVSNSETVKTVSIYMVITTNLSSEDFKSDDIKYKRTFDRIKERCHPIVINDNNIRIKIANERYKKLKNELG